MRDFDFLDYEKNEHVNPDKSVNITISMFKSCNGKVVEDFIFTSDDTAFKLGENFLEKIKKIKDSDKITIISLGGNIIAISNDYNGKNIIKDFDTFLENKKSDNSTWYSFFDEKILTEEELFIFLKEIYKIVVNDPRFVAKLIETCRKCGRQTYTERSTVLAEKIRNMELNFELHVN